jgi:uncharacterized protein with HEPN domain
MHKSPTEYLKHIRDECSYILSVIGPKVSRQSFLNDETLKRAVVRSLEIIGEPAKKIPDAFRKSQGTIEWKDMAGMRDRLIHDYMGLNYAIVWDVIRNKIPELHKHVVALIDELERDV